MFKNEIIETFFEKWEQEWIEWFREKVEERKTMGYSKFMDTYRGQLSKQNLDMILHRTFEDREGCGKSTMTIIKEDMAKKKAVLYTKIGEKVGNVTEVDLHCGQDGTPNGWVKGDKGTVRISTIIAGGYNIQCLHYRVLVK